MFALTNVTDRSPFCGLGGEGSRGPSAADEPVVCGHREQRATGVWECVRPPHDAGTSGHYYVRITTAVG